MGRGALIWRIMVARGSPLSMSRAGSGGEARIAYLVDTVDGIGNGGCHHEEVIDFAIARGANKAKMTPPTFLSHPVARRASGVVVDNSVLDSSVLGDSGLDNSMLAEVALGRFVARS